MNQFDVYSLFQRLDEALKPLQVTDADGNQRPVRANEFIYVGLENGIAKFKHGCSQNWAIFDSKKGTVELKSVENWPEPQKVWAKEAQESATEDLQAYVDKLRRENAELRKKKGLPKFPQDGSGE